MREFLLILSLSLPLSVSALAQNVEIPEGAKFQQGTFLHAEFWTYDVDGHTGNTSKNRSIRRERISSFVNNGKRICTVEYFEVL